MLIGISSCDIDTLSLTSCIDHIGAPWVILGCMGNGREYTNEGRYISDNPNELLPAIIIKNRLI